MHKSVLRIGRTAKKGHGVLSKVPIPRGAVVIRYKGRAKWIWDIPERLWDHCLQIGYDSYVVPSVGSFGWFLNHSCEPNCAIERDREIVALRDIAPGEEITFDYSTNVGWRGFEMNCSCGAKSCRGTIRSYWGLSAAQRKRYGTRVSSFLLRTKPPKSRSKHASGLLLSRSRGPEESKA